MKRKSPAPKKANPSQAEFCLMLRQNGLGELEEKLGGETEDAFFYLDNMASIIESQGAQLKCCFAFNALIYAGGK